MYYIGVAFGATDYQCATPKSVSGRSRRWTSRRVGTAAPSTLESRQEPGRATEDGAEETHHRMRKTEDRAEEIRSPEKEETPEESEGSSGATRRGEG